MEFGQVVQILWQFEVSRFWRFLEVTTKTAATQAGNLDFWNFFLGVMCKGKFMKKSENLKRFGQPVKIQRSKISSTGCLSPLSPGQVGLMSF